MALTLGLYRFNTLDTVPAAQQAIVEDMPDGALVLDTDDRIRDTNPAARRLLGDGREELVGKPVTDVVPDWGSVPVVDEPPGPVLLVGHGLTVGGVVDGLVGSTEGVDAPLCGVTLVERDGADWRLAFSGDTSHLSD